MAEVRAAHGALLPRPSDTLGRGAMLALAVHAGLIAALTASVDWRSQPVEASAELWAAVPQSAAPPAPEPAPTPPVPPPPPAPAPAPAPPPPAVAERDAEIAVERARRQAAEREAAAQARAERERQAREQAERQQAERQRAERQKADREKAEREKAERAEKARADARRREAEAAERKQAEEKRLAEQREANLRRMMGQAGADVGNGSPSSTGSAARDAAPSASYAGRVVARIKPNIVFTDTVAGNPAAEVEVRAAATGTIIARRLVRSSGNAEWDEAVLRAVDRTGTLPRDSDGRVPSTIVITFRPQE